MTHDSVVHNELGMTTRGRVACTQKLPHVWPSSIGISVGILIHNFGPAKHCGAGGHID